MVRPRRNDHLAYASGTSAPARESRKPGYVTSCSKAWAPAALRDVTPVLAKMFLLRCNWNVLWLRKSVEAISRVAEALRHEPQDLDFAGGRAVGQVAVFEVSRVGASLTRPELVERPLGEPELGLRGVLVTHGALRRGDSRPGEGRLVATAHVDPDFPGPAQVREGLDRGLIGETDYARGVFGSGADRVAAEPGGDLRELGGGSRRVAIATPQKYLDRGGQALATRDGVSRLAE